MKFGNQNSSHSLLCPHAEPHFLTWHEETAVVLEGVGRPQSQPLSGQPNPGAHTLLLHQPLGPILPHSHSPVTLSTGRGLGKLGTIIWGKCPFPLSKVNPSRGESMLSFWYLFFPCAFQMLKFTQWKMSGFLSKCTLPCPKGKNFVHRSNACHTSYL